MAPATRKPTRQQPAPIRDNGPSSPPAGGKEIGGGEITRTKSYVEAKWLVCMECPYVRKTKGPGLPYSFASEAEFIATLRPAMMRCGLLVSPVGSLIVTDESFQSQRGGVMRRVVVKMTYRFRHVFTSGEGSYEDVEMHGEAADSGDKAVNKAQTDAMKYALRQWAMIETGDDPDKTPGSYYERAPEDLKADRANEKATAQHPAPSYEAPEPFRGAEPNFTNGEPGPHYDPPEEDGPDAPSYAPPTPPQAPPQAPAPAQQAPQASHGAPPPVRSGPASKAQQFANCQGAIDTATTPAQLEIYRDIYTTQRGFDPEQIRQLDERVQGRRSVLAKAAGAARASGGPGSSQSSASTSLPANGVGSASGPTQGDDDDVFQ